MSGSNEVKPIRLAIVAPVHNRRELTLQCLRSLSRIDRTGLEVMIFIVDDGCTDGTREAVEEGFPEVKVVPAGPKPEPPPPPAGLLEPPPP